MSRTKEQRAKYGLYLKGKTYEEVFGKEKALEIKEKLRNAKLENPTSYWLGKKRLHITGEKHFMFGKHHTEDAKNKISITHKGRKLSEEHKRKISESLPKGVNHWNWFNGNKEYGIEFNRVLKEQIRKRDNYRCQECFRHQDELYSKTGKKYKLHIHHIDYDKKNNNPTNLISLCRECHLQTNYGRNDWTGYFQNKLLTIND